MSAVVPSEGVVSMDLIFSEGTGVDGSYEGAKRGEGEARSAQRRKLEACFVTSLPFLPFPIAFNLSLIQAIFS